LNEARILRERLAKTNAALDRSGGDSYGSAATVGVTTTITTYPTAAASFFAFNPCTITGTNAEGDPGTPTPNTMTTYLALNVGTQVPPAGTALVFHMAGGRWTFRYDG
jgi:hypothetical protein